MQGRKEERFDSELAIKLEGGGKAVARNVSASGVYFVTDVALEAAQLVRFSLEFHGLPQRSDRGELQCPHCAGRGAGGRQGSRGFDQQFRIPQTARRQKLPLREGPNDEHGPSKNPALDRRLSTDAGNALACGPGGRSQTGE